MKSRASVSCFLLRLTDLLEGTWGRQFLCSHGGQIQNSRGIHEKKKIEKKKKKFHKEKGLVS